MPKASALMVAQVNRKLAELLCAPALSPGLYIVATPIGNLSDITLRALTTLSRVNAIYCEDTRHSKKLLTHYSIRQPLHSYHDHSSAADGDRLLTRIENGESIALVSDAGTPLVSDPGYPLVRAAHDRNIMVTSLPGASAITTALSMAGLPTDSFLFAGFLPSRTQARQKRLGTLKDIPGTLVFYESPRRIHKTLQDMSAIFGKRQAVLARELTKLYETLYRGELQELAIVPETLDTRGEYVIIIAPPDQKASITDDIILKQLATEMSTASLRDAVNTVTKKLDLPRKRVYALGLSLKKHM